VGDAAPIPAQAHQLKHEQNKPLTTLPRKSASQLVAAIQAFSPANKMETMRSVVRTVNTSMKQRFTVLTVLNYLIHRFP
jgi:hypothetical protein